MLFLVLEVSDYHFFQDDLPICYAPVMYSAYEPHFLLSFVMLFSVIVLSHLLDKPIKIIAAPSLGYLQDCLQPQHAIAFELSFVEPLVRRGLMRKLLM